MKVRYIQTRKHGGQEYKFYYNCPEYDKEKGILGIEIEPYVTVKSEPNTFGYPNVIELEDVKTYDEKGFFSHMEKIAVAKTRAENRSVLKALTKQMIALENKLREA